jgi:hypothetical protein
MKRDIFYKSKLDKLKPHIFFKFLHTKKAQKAAQKTLFVPSVRIDGISLKAFYIIASGKNPGFSCGDESERQTREGSPLLQV